MFNKELVNDYLEIIKSNPKLYYDDYLDMQEKVNNSSAIYKNKPIPVTYQGMYIGEEDLEEFKNISKMLMEITRKVTDEFVKNPEYRALFKCPEDWEKLILHDPGYDIPVPICRYDVFYNGIDDYKFCEFNTDGSSAMNEDWVLGGIMLESKGFKKYREKYDMQQFELFDSWVQKSIEIFHMARPDVEKPNVAIVDFIDKGTTNEFIKFKECYENAGYACEIVDPRHIEYKDGAIYSGDFKIDMVYRRAVTMDVMEKADEIKPFLDAYLDDAYVMIGSFRSQIMHSKLIFKILRLKETRAFLTNEENEFLQMHVPFTEEFITEDDYERVRTYKDNYILKPYDGYASYSVYAGKEHSREEWAEILRKLLGQNYIYQEYFEMKKIDFVEFDLEGNLHIIPFAFVLGMFIYGEEFQGLYTRIGNEALISGARKYYTTPNFLVTKK